MATVRATALTTGPARELVILRFLPRFLLAKEQLRVRTCQRRFSPC